MESEATHNRTPAVGSRLRPLVGVSVTRIYFSGRPATRTDYGSYRSERLQRIMEAK